MTRRFKGKRRRRGRSHEKYHKKYLEEMEDTGERETTLSGRGKKEATRSQHQGLGDDAWKKLNE